jgi:ribose-phosphate pyrophosphokinase
VKRADRFRAALAQATGREPVSAFMEKYRALGVVRGAAVVGEVGDRIAIIVDDLISTGTTMARAAQACRARGAKAVYVAATHGLFMPGADAVLADPAIDQVVVTNTVPPFRLDPALVAKKLSVVDATPLFAQAIRRLHDNGSIVDLLAT